MRLPVIRNIIVFLFLILLINLFRMQCIKGPDYFRQSENNRIRLVPEGASRGIIYDRTGMPLVRNRLVFDVVAVPQEIAVKDKTSLFSKLSGFLDISSEVLADTFHYNYSAHAAFYPVMLVSNISRNTAFLIEQDRASLPGIFVQPRALRYYLYGKDTAHVLGYVGKMHQNEYERLKEYGYERRDFLGRSGIEKKFDHVLRGEAGGMQLEVDSEGSIIEVLGYKPPVRGEDLHLTIDIGLQTNIAEWVGEHKGAVGVMDAENGEVLALYSSPSYDPNVLIDRKDSEEISKILNSKDAPLLNRAVCGYAPGSIFKIVTAYAGLIEKEIDFNTTFHCPGYYKIGKAKLRCWLKQGHGGVSVENAIATSCNVFFCNTARKLGADRIAKYAKEFGLGRKTMIELPAEQIGVVPTLAWKRSKLNQKWYGGDTLNFSIGQGYLLVSPVQALKMVAFVANDGKEVMPHLIKGQGKKSNIRILSMPELQIIKHGMKKVISADYGTGHRAKVSGVQMYGKTGTAQVGNRSPHAWFTGYAEVKDQKFCFIVFLENGGHGGAQAADIAKQIVLYLRDDKDV
ncbi:MAG: penicillin-binding protein 2 [PVC group bacterium]|nr:penicillin-binding protein 2 [PVC group bacterium]